MEKYKMIGETTDRYFTNCLEDGKVEISILIPAKFKWLWIDKLNDLYTTDEEIEYYQSEEHHEGIHFDKEDEQNATANPNEIEKKIKELSSEEVFKLCDYLEDTIVDAFDPENDESGRQTGKKSVE